VTGSVDKVVVTGASGFIGRAVARALAARGATVIGTHRGARPPDVAGVVWERVDLEDPAAVRALLERHRPDGLVALGWYMGPGNQQALENFLWIKHGIDLLIAFSETGGRRVVFCGSCMEYDWSREAPLVEDITPLAPATEYGAAKAALFTAFGPLCGKLGLSGAWARPFFLYGPGENPRRLAADVILSLLEGREALCTHGRQRRDLLHVDDVGEAMAALLATDITGAMNIGSGTAIPLATLVEEIGRQTGRADLIRLGAREARPKDPPLVEASTERLGNRLGWTPRFDLEAGIADTIAWWRAHLKERETQ
jgi:nucleoside-diphosphate-sugar epimerase